MQVQKNRRDLNAVPVAFAFACDPVGIRTQDPQLRRLLLYPAELPDHPLMDLVSFSQASSTRSFYVWLSHTKHHARTYAHAICGCKGTLFLRTSQINSKIFFSVRQFLCHFSLEVSRKGCTFAVVNNKEAYINKSIIRGFT